MRKEIFLRLKKQVDNSYTLVIGENLNIASEIKKLKLSNHFAIITDDRVYELYKDYIKDQFTKEGFNFKFIVFKNGERRKNLSTFSKISEKMLEYGFNRKSVVIAFGGGVVGDMAGYVAGTFMRGIPFIQIPTTLLAQVDSSIGGKVAVDLKSGKNSSGLFYQPLKVIIDTMFLETLSCDEFYNGLFEIIKHSIIKDKKYFDFIVDNIEDIKNRKQDVLINLIYKSCLIKSDVVMKDEKESDLRRILNFGHTIGHAIETLSHYKIKHGFAVAEGMLKEAEISKKLKILDSEEFDKIYNLLKEFGIKEKKYLSSKLLKIMKNDKKNVYEGKKFNLLIPIVLPEKIGKVKIKNFSIKELENLL